MGQLAKILIIGINSKIGSLAADQFAAQSYEVYGTTRRKNSIANNVQYLNLVDKLEKWPNFPNCEIALICTSIHSVDECEKYPKKTRLLNVNAICNLVKRLIEKQCFVLFPSTNMVFNGQIPFAKPNHQTSPTTVYASQKVIVENFLLEKTDNAAIIRFTKILDKKHDLFTNWITDLKRGEKIISYSNKYFSPISIDCAVDALIKIAENKMKGIFHLSGSSDISFSSAAKHIAYRLKKEKSMIIELKQPTKPEETRIPPKYTTLAQSDIFNGLGHPTDPHQVIDYVCDWDWDWDWDWE